MSEKMPNDDILVQWIDGKQSELFQEYEIWNKALALI